jgi:hypothetical protein
MKGGNVKLHYAWYILISIALVALALWAFIRMGG